MLEFYLQHSVLFTMFQSKQYSNICKRNTCKKYKERRKKDNDVTCMHKCNDLCRPDIMSFCLIPISLSETETSWPSWSSSRDFQMYFWVFSINQNACLLCCSILCFLFVTTFVWTFNQFFRDVISRSIKTQIDRKQTMEKNTKRGILRKKTGAIILLIIIWKNVIIIILTRIVSKYIN